MRPALIRSLPRHKSTSLGKFPAWLLRAFYTADRTHSLLDGLLVIDVRSVPYSHMALISSRTIPITHVDGGIF